MEQSPSGAATVEKAVDVLQFLHDAGSAQGVTAVGRGLGLPKATAHRLLRALGRRGLVEQEESGRYRPGLGLVALGLGALEREPVVAFGRGILEAEAERIGETIFLAGARAGRVLVLDKCEGSGFLRAAPRVGDEIPAHATAVGKVCLAFASDQVRVGRLDAYTDRTITDGPALQAALTRVRERGWAENREEWMPGLVGVAAPVMAHGRLVASLAASGAAARAHAWEADAIRPLCDAAHRIGERIERGAR
jgi:DNA-binding IclR family transcriptional regulator